MSKILVICFSSINNVAMAIPVIHSLATQYAQHQIMVLSIDTFSPLFENVPTMLFSVGQISEENMPD